MTIHVLGLGETVSTYRSNGIDATVGVNDIFSKHPVDYLVLADFPKAFREPDRYKTIIESTPKKFYSPFEWPVKNFVKIELSSGRGNCKEIDGPKFPFSNNSPFVACVVAYRLGAKRIIMHGVDFNSHAVLSSERNKNTIIDHYTNLRNALSARGVSLLVSHQDSLLSKILPVAFGQ